MSHRTPSLNRRQALGVFAASAALPAVLTASPGPIRRSPTDPDMLNPEVSWSGVLTDAELAIIASMSDLIIPADETSPAASSLGCHHYVNEYVSAPYPASEAALRTLRDGLAWLATECTFRFGRPFTALKEAEKLAICDDIRWVESASAQHKPGAEFFNLVRFLVVTAFYTTDEGMADIGYVGNRAAASFEGPSAEILAKLGL